MTFSIRSVSLCLVSVLLMAVSSPRAAHAVALTIAPAETAVTVGDPVVLRVLVDAVPDLKGADLIYGYTPGRLTLTSASAAGAMVGLGGTVFEQVLPDVVSPPDSVWVDVARLDGTGSGPGVVVFLRFLTHTQGNAFLSCLFTDLRDSANMPLSPSCAGAIIHIIGPVPTLRSTWAAVKAIYR